MMNILIAITAFLVALAILITFHEFGHFWVARKLGIKVLRFSVGFGKPLISWRDKQDTEYVIAAIPLGGYVKMLDEKEGSVAEADLPKAFNRQSVYKRFAVVAAGPIFNVIFAIFAFWLMFVIGITSVAPIIGSVTPDSAAAKAGLKSMQEIIAVDKVTTPNWRSVSLQLMSLIGTEKQIQIHVHHRKSKADDIKILNLAGWQLDKQNPQPIHNLGITPYYPKLPPVIAKIVANEPAAIAGLQAGDKIKKINNTTIKDWNSFVTYIRVHPDQTLNVVIQRGNKRKTIKVTPRVLTGKDGKQYGFIGVQSLPINWPKDMLRKQQYAPWSAVWPAVKETGKITRLTFQILGKLFTGHVPWQSISGPVGIAQGAGQSASIGLAYYLGFLALVSISLAILNILPIPMLDGGHLMYYLIEMLRRRPVSDRAQEIGFRVGLLLLLGLMALALYNDLVRVLGLA